MTLFIPRGFFRVPSIAIEGTPVITLKLKKAAPQQ